MRASLSTIIRRVRIFQKVTALSEAEIRDRLLWGVNQPWEPQRYPSEKWLQLDRPADEIEVTTDAGWNTLAVDNSHARDRRLACRD